MLGDVDREVLASVLPFVITLHNHRLFSWCVERGILMDADGEILEECLMQSARWGLIQETYSLLRVGVFPVAISEKMVPEAEIPAPIEQTRKLFEEQSRFSESHM